MMSQESFLMSSRIYGIAYQKNGANIKYELHNISQSIYASGWVEDTFSEHQEIAPGIYIPTKSVRRYVSHKKEDKLDKSLASHSTSYNSDISLHSAYDHPLFQFRFPPGTNITDGISRKVWIVQEDGSWQPKLSRGKELIVDQHAKVLIPSENIKLHAQGPTRMEPRGSGFWFFWGGVCLILLAVAIWLKRKYELRHEG